MKILPQINYLFSMIPFKPTLKWFQTLDSAIMKFYSKNKKAKISLSTLQENKLEGGLESPNFMCYYLANQLQYLTKWLHPKEEFNSWIELEQLDCYEINLTNLPFITDTLKRNKCFKNPMIVPTLSALEITDSKLEPCMLFPMCINPDFVISEVPLHFKPWEQKGITHLHLLFQDNTLMTYTKLSEHME